VIENFEGLSPIVVPHSGYPKGWNVILYNDEKNSAQNVTAALMNGGFSQQAATLIVMITGQNGFFCIPFGPEKEKAEKCANEIGRVGVQHELLLTEEEPRT